MSDNLAIDAIIDEVKKQDEQYMDAGLRPDPDVEWLKNMMDDDYIFISGKGQITNKEIHLTSLQSGALKYESFKLSNIQVRMFGDTAILISSVEVKGTNNDKDISGQYIATRVYIRQGGRWRIVSAQATPVPQ